LYTGYFGGGGLFNTSCPGLPPKQISFGPGFGFRGDQNNFGRSEQVVVEWSILGALTHAVKTHNRDDYFCGRLEEFLDATRLDTNSLSPRIIAVCPYKPDVHWEAPTSWMKTAKRVSGKHEERLMDNISQWISQNDEDSAARGEKLKNELKRLLALPWTTVTYRRGSSDACTSWGLWCPG